MRLVGLEHTSPQKIFATPKLKFFNLCQELSILIYI